MLTAVVLLYLRSDGVVSMGEYMSFMISRETENVGSSQEVINAFKALTEGGKRPYVTEAELYQVIIHKYGDTVSCMSYYFVLMR